MSRSEAKEKPAKEPDKVVTEEEEDSGDEEEVKEDLDVLLGFVEEPQHPAFLRRQYFPSKVGGKPVISWFPFEYLRQRPLPHRRG